MACAMHFQVIQAFLLTLLATTATEEQNKTELHVGIQNQMVLPERAAMPFWVNHIVSYINRMDMIPGYKIVADFLYIPGIFPIVGLGDVLVNLTDYLAITNAYCYIGNSVDDRALLTADVTAAKKLVQIAPEPQSPLLSNKEKYPYFLRTVASDGVKMEIVVKLLELYNWKKFAVISMEWGFVTLYNKLLNLLAEKQMPPTFATLYPDFDPLPAIKRLKSVGVDSIKGLCARPIRLASLSIGKMHQEIAQSYNPDDPNTALEWIRNEPGYGQIADALLTCAMALNSTRQDIYPRKLEDLPYQKTLADRIYHHAINLRFNGLSGNVSFTDKGDRFAVFKVYQVKNGSMDEPIMVYFEEGDRLEYLRSEKDIWQHSGGIPIRDAYLISVTVLTVTKTLFYTYLAFAAVAMVLSLVLIIAQIVLRNKSVVKYSWPLLNYVISVGCIVVSVVVILKGVDVLQLDKQQILLICKVINWLLALGFTLTIGTMMTKLGAIYMFFSKKRDGKKTVGECGYLCVVAVMVLVDVVILLLWMLTDPLNIGEVVVNEKIDPATQTTFRDLKYSCTSTNATYWLIAFICYKGIVLILGGFLTWPAWVLSARYGVTDSHYLGIAVYVGIIACMVAVPVSFVLQESPSLQYGIVGGLVLISVMLTVCLLLFPKLILARKSNDERIAAANSPIGALFGFM